ncbi:hypothetical protein [Jiulongibacter sp. NS-SX5]|uniref:hypothetical protein n=1 Tax=Jiulongibacter sp. NS-SX5 TaxID=3463854 RepID=UPI0040587FF0
MKTLFVLISLMSLTCSSPVSNEGSQANEDLKKRPACEAIELSHLIALLDWNAENIVTQDLGFNEKRSACQFIHQEEKLFIRLGWNSEKAIENKVSENRFKNYLQNGEDGVIYESIDSNKILFGQKEDRFGNKIYLLRKRFDNKAEAQIELNTEKTQADEVKNMLLHLMEKL